MVRGVRPLRTVVGGQASCVKGLRKATKSGLTSRFYAGTNKWQLSFSEMETPMQGRLQGEVKTLFVPKPKVEIPIIHVVLLSKSVR